MNKYSLPVPKDRIDIRPAPSHKRYKNLRYCIDFALPLRTPIQAVQKGEIVSIENRFAKSYSDPSYASKSNYVYILHEDGRISIYAHLLRWSVRVRVRQNVRRGQIIGLSGQTGFATYPHLHFGLYDPKGKNIPIVFAD